MVPKAKIFGPTNVDALIDGLIWVVFEKKKSVNLKLFYCTLTDVSAFILLWLNQFPKNVLLWLGWALS